MPTHSPATDVGGGQVQDKTKVTLAELIAKVNDLFASDLSPGDKLVDVNDAIQGKMMEPEKLTKKALNSAKKQFDNTPDLDKEL